MIVMLNGGTHETVTPAESTSVLLVHLGFVCYYLFLFVVHIDIVVGIIGLTATS